MTDLAKLLELSLVHRGISALTHLAETPYQHLCLEKAKSALTDLANTLNTQPTKHNLADIGEMRRKD